MDFQGKGVIVTGAAQGLGKAYAAEFARRGAKVAVADLNGDGASKVADELKKEGGNAMAVRVDITNEANTLEMARSAAASFGTIDILVNNAGIYYGIAEKSTDQITVEEWKRMMDVNVLGTWLASRAAIPYMKTNKRGKIVNVSSSTAIGPVPNISHYITSKAAVIGLTRALALELGQFGITVNAVAPGFTLTEASLKRAETNPNLLEYTVRARAIKRPETTGDVVGAVLFLASEESDFISGQTLVVDGGTRFV